MSIGTWWDAVADNTVVGGASRAVWNLSADFLRELLLVFNLPVVVNIIGVIGLVQRTKVVTRFATMFATLRGVGQVNISVRASNFTRLVVFHYLRGPGRTTRIGRNFGGYTLGRGVHGLTKGYIFYTRLISFCVLQTGGNFRLFIELRSLVGTVGRGAQGTGVVVLGRGNVGCVQFTSRVYGGYICELIVCVLKDTSLLGFALIRGGGTVTRKGHLFLVIDGVGGYCTGTFLGNFGLLLRVLTGLWVGHARELIGRRRVQPIYGYTHSYRPLLLATQGTTCLPLFGTLWVSRLGRFNGDFTGFTFTRFLGFKTRDRVFGGVRVQGGDVTLGSDICLTFVQQSVICCLALGRCVTSIKLGGAHWTTGDNYFTTTKEAGRHCRLFFVC